MSLFQDKNKIIKHNQFTEAFKSDPKKQDENDENETESTSNEKEGKQIEKRNLQIEEFTKRSTTPTRFDYAFYNKNNKNDKDEKNDEKHEDEEETSQKNSMNTSQSHNFIYDERLKDPIRRSYFKSNKANNNKTSKDNTPFIDYRAYQFKVIMLGNIAVGKTCLLSYFVDSLFKDNYSCTVGVDFKVKTVVLSENLKVDLQIWDTSGEERFRTITKQYYRDAAGIVLVFDVTNEKSFSDLEKWVDEINSTAKRNVNVILIGNKADLASERVVSYEKASRFASRRGIEYYEASAKTGQQVEEIYFRLSGNMVNTLEEEEMKEGKDEQNIVMDSSKVDVSVNEGRGNGRNGNLKIGSRKKNKNCCGG